MLSLDGVYGRDFCYPGKSFSWIPACAGMTNHGTGRQWVMSFLRRQESTAFVSQQVNSRPIYTTITAPHAPSFLRPGSSTKRLRFVGVERQESITLSTDPKNSQPIHTTTTASHASSFLRPGSSTKRLRFVGVERQESIAFNIVHHKNREHT